ncbi:MAG: hypothetical protein AUK35_06510 [Zetaproteobacteria bacterium CG2_30_46_52]|nr:MAG: hypothetical protein AUK35_06510 [Zetaproteobacteria bacterium CG2_30_46_52]
MDKYLDCCDCQKGFVWTTGEQNFYRKLNFSQPRRCKACRLPQEVSLAMSFSSLNDEELKWARNVFSMQHHQAVKQVSAKPYASSKHGIEDDYNTRETNPKVPMHTPDVWLLSGLLGLAVLLLFGMTTGSGESVLDSLFALFK